jgi:hypothetical protein
VGNALCHGKIRRNWAQEFETGVAFRSIILGIFPADEPAPTEEAVRKLSQEWASRNDLVAMAAVMRTAPDLLVTDADMANVRVPTQAVVGTVHPALRGVAALSHVWPALKVVTIPGATHSNVTGGHRGAAGRPEFVNAIKDFIAAHGAHGG